MLVASALRLLGLTVAWNGAVGAASLAAALAAGSLALAAFALNALVDSTASIALIWRFHAERRDPDAADRLEARAERVIAAAMAGTALFVGVQASRGLLAGHQPALSLFGVVLAAASIAVLPWLGRAKRRRGADLASRSLRGDGTLTLAAAALAATALLALVLNEAFRWWWADAAAALLIAVAIGGEAARVAAERRRHASA